MTESKAATTKAASTKRGARTGEQRRAIATTEAKARVRRMLNELDSGRLLGDGNFTVEQVLDRSTAKALPNCNLQPPKWLRQCCRRGPGTS